MDLLIQMLTDPMYWTAAVICMVYGLFSLTVGYSVGVKTERERRINSTEKLMQLAITAMDTTYEAGYTAGTKSRVVPRDERGRFVSLKV